MKFALVGCAVAVLLAGCAGDESGDHHHRPGDGPGPGGDHAPRQLPSLFISPAGQPFRAGPGEPYPVIKWFTQADKNGDGKLDRVEFRADAEQFFHQLDKNHDGVIDGFEVTDYENDVAPEIIGAYRGDGGGYGAGAPRHRRDGGERGGQQAPGAGAGGVAVLQGAAVYGLLNEPEPVSAADLDLSGRITLAEFIKSADRRFDELDKKQLGYLTLADLPKTPAQAMMSGRRKRGDDSPGASAGPPAGRRPGPGR